MLTLLAACTPDPVHTTPDDPVVTDPEDSGTTPVDPPDPADVSSASCVPDPTNALRATCTVTLSAASAVALEISDGSESAVFTSPLATMAHTVPLWGLTAGAEWTFTARAGAEGATIDGAFTTGALPPDVSFDVGLTTTGGPSALVDVMTVASCPDEGWVVAWDALGRIRWYQQLSDADQVVNMFEYTTNDTLLAIVGQEVVVEMDLAGTVLLSASDFPLPLHHDITRRAGKIWVLMADAAVAPNGRTYVQDLVVTLDDAGVELARWDEADHLDPTLSTAGVGQFWEDEFPGAIDAWHTNALSVQDDESFVVSLEKEHTLANVVNGEIVWFFDGDGIDGAYASDVIFLPGGGDPQFGGEHHLRLLPNGHVTVFDNNGPPRGLELDLDQTALVARFIADWQLPGLTCPNQGSLFELPDGHHLVTFANDHVIAEFDAAGVEIMRFRPTCDTAAMPLTVRGQPLDLWTATAGGVTAARGIAPPTR